MLGRQTAFLHKDAGMGWIAQSSGTKICQENHTEGPPEKLCSPLTPPYSQGRAGLLTPWLRNRRQKGATVTCLFWRLSHFAFLFSALLSGKALPFWFKCRGVSRFNLRTKTPGQRDLLLIYCYHAETISWSGTESPRPCLGDLGVRDQWDNPSVCPSERVQLQLPLRRHGRTSDKPLRVTSAANQSGPRLQPPGES